jgi:hypothetical protein
MRRFQRFTRATRLGWLLGVGAGASGVACSTRAMTEQLPVSEAADVIVSGGQSGGEGQGSLPAPPSPCACLFSGVLGEVLESAAPCTRVRVLDTFDIYPNIAVGEVLVGVLELACAGSASINPGDQILFEYLPPAASDQCPERSDCWQTCIPASAECGRACATATAAACADDVAMPHQTGRILALSAGGDQVSFRFAGRDRTASIEEVLDFTCYEKHERVLDDYERERAETAAIVNWPPVIPPVPEMSLVPPSPPDPAECYGAQSD